MAQRPNDLASLLFIENIRDAGWGVIRPSNQPSPFAFSAEEWGDKNNEKARGKGEEGSPGPSSHTFIIPQEESFPKGRSPSPLGFSSRLVSL